MYVQCFKLYSNNTHLAFQSPQTHLESSPTSSWWLECPWKCREWQEILRWPSQIHAASEHNKGQNPRKAFNFYAVTQTSYGYWTKTYRRQTTLPIDLKKLKIQCKRKLRHIILFHKKNMRVFSSTYLLFSCIWILLCKPQFSALIYTYETSS